jgi:GNAT superfamily N-acetyltransferase
MSCILGRQTVVVSPTIRAPRTDELEQLREIERAAGDLFAEIGLEQVAAAEPASVEALAQYVLDGRAWLIADGDVPFGYAVVDVVDGLAHLEQLSVLPNRGRQGFGAALLEHVCDWATRHRFAGVTLTTFTDVPWNAPFYAKHGFRVMNDSEVGPELRDLGALEAAHGLDPAQRVCMRRDAGPA